MNTFFFAKSKKKLKKKLFLLKYFEAKKIWLAHFHIAVTFYQGVHTNGSIAL